MLCCCVQYVEIYTDQRAFACGVNFCFHLKKTAAELYRLLREAYGERAPSQDTCGRWFWRFKSGDFDTIQEERQGIWKNAKKLEVVKLQALLEQLSGKMIRKHKNNSPSNWVSVNKLFPVGYERWERFKTPIDGYHMN